MARDKSGKLLQQALDDFRRAYDYDRENRENAARDIAFENGEQWDERSRRERENAGRPCPVVNKVAGIVKQIIGDARQNRPKIKVRPVDSEADPSVAEILTAIIRNIENVSDAEAAYDTGLEAAVRAGIGYWRILTDYTEDSFDQEIFIRRVPDPFCVFFDPDAIEADFSDARYCFVTEELTKEEFERKYPDASFSSWQAADGNNRGYWAANDKIRVAEYFYKEKYTRNLYELVDGRVIEVVNPREAVVPTPLDIATPSPASETPPERKFVVGDNIMEPIEYRRSRKAEAYRVKWAKLTAGEVIEGPRDWAGRYIPVIPCLGEELFIGGKRVLRSAIRFAIDAQKLYNWTRATEMEIMALGPKQPYIGTPAMFEGHENQWRFAHRTPQPYLLANFDGGVLPQRQQLDVSTTGTQNSSLLAADDIKATTGIYDASLGARGNETSGRAIIARQREGDTATYVYTDNQVRAIKHTGRVLVDLIPKIYDTERVVRLVGEDLNKSFRDTPGVRIASDGRSAWTRVNIVDPATGKIVANDLCLGKYDVVIDAGPGYQTKRLEAAEGMLQVLQAFPQAAPVIAPRIAKNLDWPEAQELAEELKAFMQPSQPDPKMQLELQGKQLDNQSKMLDIQGKAIEQQKTGDEENRKMVLIAEQVTATMLRQLGLIR